jgi:hypothetical protein
MPDCATTALACTPKGTYVAHFVQANFELHPYDAEK